MALGPTRPSVQCIPGFSRGKERPGRDADPSLLLVLQSRKSRAIPLTYLLTPLYRVRLEKLTGLQLVKKFAAFHGTRRFITALTSVRQLFLSWANPIQSIYAHPNSWRSILILSTHLRLGLPSGSLPSSFPTTIIYTPSPHPYAPHAQPISFFSILSPAQYWVSSTNRPIPPLPLWAIRPVQSLSSCTTVHFTFTYTSTPPMDRTACTEPQFLYNGALYLYLYLYSPYGPYGLYRASVPVQRCTLPLPIPLLPLSAVRPVQSLSSCTTVHFTFTYTSTPSMGRTACTEPQCLYNGAL